MTLRNSGGAGDRGRRGNDGEKSRLSRWAVIAAIPLLIVLVSILAWPGRQRPDRPAAEKAASSENGQAAVQEAALQKETAPGSVEPPLPDLEDLERPLAERITELRQRVQQHPDDAEAWGVLGGVLDAHDFNGGAIRCYEQARALDALDFRWPYFLGYCHELDDHEAALASFLHAAQLNGDYAPLHVNIGRGYLFAEDLEKADEHLARASELDPGLVRTWIDRAQVALTAGDADRAVEYLERALDLGPSSGEAYLLLAGAYQKLGRRQEAERLLALGQAKGKREPLPDILRNLWLSHAGVTMRWHRTRGDQLLASGRIPEAITEWRRAVENYPDLAEAHGQLGFALVRGRQIDEGVASLRTALAMDPQAHKVRQYLGGILIQQGDAPEGLDHLRQAAEGLVNDPEAQFNIARTFSELSLDAEALEVVERGLAANPDDARLIGLRGRLLLDRGRTSEAREDLVALLEAHPEDPQRHLDLAQAYGSDGLYAEQIETLRAARERHPQHPGIAQELAWQLASCPEVLFRNGVEAAEIMAPLCRESDLEDPAQLDVLAAAHAEQGNFEAAVQMAGRALYLLSSPRGEAGGEQAIIDLDLHRALLERLRLYKRGVSYVQTP